MIGPAGSGAVERDESLATNEPMGGGTNGKQVGPIATVLILLYLILVTILLVYSLVQLWPTAPISGGEESGMSEVTLFNLRLAFSNEVRLLMVVVVAGATGSMVHALRSYYKYVGSQALKWSWVAMYVMLPFVGATLALLFYLVVRGGFFSPEASVSETSPSGFAALAGLVGLFSEQAAQKLRSIAGTLFQETPSGPDPLPESEDGEH